MMRPLFMILVLLITYLQGLSQVSVSAEFEHDKILIGDQAKLQLKANYPDDHEVTGVDLSVLDSVFAQANPSTPDEEPGILEVLEQGEWETLKNAGTTTYRKDLIITCWKEGVYSIPQIRFNFRHKGTAFSRATGNLNLLVSSPIPKSEVVDTVQIAPIKDIVEEQWQFSDFLPIVYWLGAVTLVLLSIIFVVLYFIRKKQGPPPIDIVKRPAHEIAFHKLNVLANATLWQKGEVKEYQSQLTYILREYIENRYEVPALESTTGQILKKLKGVAFPNDLVEKMKEMLQLADMVKFAKANPPEEMNTRLMAYAEEIVERTKREVSIEDQQKLEAAAGSGISEIIIASTSYVSPGKRLLAYLLDGIFFHTLTLPLILLVGILLGLNPLRVSIWEILGVSLLTTLFTGFIYFAIPHFWNGQSFGKLILDIKVCQADGKPISLGKAFLRFSIKLLSYTLLFLPFLTILFNRRKQALHDIVSNTIVIKK